MTQQTTPYDQRIEKLLVQERVTPDDRMELSYLRFAREGYLAAVADHADLLAAAIEIDRNMGHLQTGGWVKLRAALAKHTSPQEVKHGNR